MKYFSQSDKPPIFQWANRHSLAQFWDFREITKHVGIISGIVIYRHSFNRFERDFSFSVLAMDASSLIMVNNSETNPTSSSAALGPSTANLTELWEQAVKEYQATARLTASEKKLIQLTTPDQIFNVTRELWKKNIGNKQWKFHQEAQATVNQVLGVIDLIGASLGLAASVSPHPWKAYWCS